MKPTIMLDMDGVIADFMCVYTELSPRNDSRSKFREAVMTHQIFDLLPKLPNADRLLKLLKELDVDMEILSSTGTHDKEISTEAIRQKTKWLERHGINVKMNFVPSWSIKENYSSPRMIMIDDRDDVIDQFVKHGGHGILYDDYKFDSIQHEIREKVQLVRQYLDMDTILARHEHIAGAL